MRRHRPFYIPPLGLLARVFVGLGHEVTVLTQALPDGGKGRFEEDGAEVHYLRGIGAGKSVMEAMAAGLPVVSYAVPGQDTLIEHGITGWLERPRDAESLAARLDALLADPAAATAMGAAARRKLEREFAPAVIGARWTALMRSVVETHAARRGGLG